MSNVINFRAANCRTSNLRFLIGDHQLDGPNTVLVLEGFKDEKEIEAFMGALLRAGVVKCTGGMNGEAGHV